MPTAFLADNLIHYISNMCETFRDLLKRQGRRIWLKLKVKRRCYVKSSHSFNKAIYCIFMMYIYEFFPYTPSFCIPVNTGDSFDIILQYITFCLIHLSCAPRLPSRGYKTGISQAQQSAFYPVRSQFFVEIEKMGYSSRFPTGQYWIV